MKSLFTKSLLAVAVSFTLAACGSSGGGSSNEPETPAQPVNTETTQPVAAQPTEQPAEQPTEQPTEQPQPVVNNNYIEGWRVSNYILYKNDLGAYTMWETETARGMNTLTSSFALLDADQESFYGQDEGFYAIDFQELAKQDGKAYLDFHSGTLKDEALHSDYTYAFVNEPYALYGVFTNANTGEPRAFALAYDYSKAKSDSFFSDGDMDNAGVPLSGTLTYKGEVVGAKTIFKEKENSYENKSAALVSPAKKDGTVELVVTLKGNNSRIKGTINSNSVGEITLTSVQPGPSTHGDAKTKDGKLTGEHKTKILRINDPEKSTATGIVRLTNAEETEGYIGAFGAKRQ
ncbi:PT domain-containing protein [Avibacterium avium]|uniref:PT domain-containing protein n=1 Tax=Avibacterium avium TaxID=751 RepID=UPI003BF7C6B3